MDAPLDRRAFLETAAGPLALLVSRQGLASAQAPGGPPLAAPAVRFGVVGLGMWEREIGIRVQTVAPMAELAFRKGRQVRFDERKHEVVA